MQFRCLLLAFVIPVSMSSVGGVRADIPPDAAKVEESKRISLLIRQLGSTEFEERESATKALKGVGVPALKALKQAAATNADAEVRRRAADLVERIENSLDQLLLDYRSFGLPVPPDKAPLVRFEDEPAITYLTVDRNGKVQKHPKPPTFELGFLIEPATKDRLAKLLYGTEFFERETKKVGPSLDPPLMTTKDVEANKFEPSGALGLSLQMHARGWKIAETVFEKGFHAKSKDSPRTGLRLLAWEYWDQQLLDAKADHWLTACKQMKALLADERKLDTPENRSLLKSLEAALVPGKAKPGSMESLIDDLINVRDIKFSDERFARVLDLGFEVVPALLAHLDDDRLTHYRQPGWGLNQHYEPAYHYRVRDVASYLIRSFAGDAATREWPIDWRNDRVAEKRLATEWWDEARKLGEEAYLLAHVLPPALKEDKAELPEETQAYLIGKKYPKRLAQLYKDVLDKRPHLHTRLLAEAVGTSSLPRKEKVELLALAAVSKNPNHRREAFLPLQELDAERFVTLLVTTLEDLSRTPTVPYSQCPEVWFAELVGRTDDKRAWQALEKAARRSDVGLRTEMIEMLDKRSLTAAQRRRRLAFLAAFLDDATVRDISTNKEMFVGDFAGDSYPRLEVRNFAALKIAKIVKTPIEPTAEWTEKEWIKLRDQMREVVKQELAKAAKE